MTETIIAIASLTIIFRQIGRASIDAALAISKVARRWWCYSNIDKINLAYFFSSSVPFWSFNSKTRVSTDKYPTVNPDITPANKVRAAETNRKIQNSAESGPGLSSSLVIMLLI